MSLPSGSDSLRRLHKKALSITLLPMVVLCLVFSFCQGSSASPSQDQGSLSACLLATPSPPHRTHSEVTLSKGKFLVASQSMGDPRFSETVILLIEYGFNGAIGLIINRPTEVRLSEVLPEIKELSGRTDAVYFGGPVGINQLFLLIGASRQPEESHHVFADVYASSSHKSLEKIVSSTPSVKRFRAYAGYAGWAPLQLDLEVSRGDWHILQADTETIFNKKGSEIWRELIRRVSVQWVGVTNSGRDGKAAGQ